MIEQQIKQNAHDYTYTNDHNWTWDGSGESRVDISAEISDAHIAGAHSRDEEINDLQEQYNKISLSRDELVSVIRILSEKINQFLNPWISVKDRLPEKYVDCDGVEHDCSDRVIVKLKDGKYTHLAEYYHDTNEWLSLELCSSTDYYDNVTHWMPMPE